MLDLTLLTANLSGAVSSATFSGREFLIAPVTLIVPGVLNGSKGPLLYQLDDLKKSADAWNGMPLVLDHPKLNGQHVSARDPQVLEQFGLGHVFNAHTNGKLTAEAWFDIEKTNRIDNRLIELIKNGQKVELSTGLFTDDEPAEGVTENGVQYRGVARNHRPDHLAILPDSIGACSVMDGCGVNVNQDGEAAEKSLFQRFRQWWAAEQTRNEPPPKGETQMNKQQLIDGLIANCDCWTEKDKDTLNGFTEEKLKSLFDHSEDEKQLKANLGKATADITTDAGVHKFDAKAGKWVFNAKQPTTPAEPTANAQSKPPTTEEWLKSAPEEVRNAVQHSQSILNRERQKLIEGIKANERNKFSDEQLAGMSLETLEGVAELARNEADSDPEPFPSYFGMSAPAANYRGVELPEAKPMPRYSLTDFDDAGQSVKSA